MYIEKMQCKSECELLYYVNVPTQIIGDTYSRTQTVFTLQVPEKSALDRLWSVFRGRSVTSVQQQANMLQPG